MDLLDLEIESDNGSDNASAKNGQSMSEASASDSNPSDGNLDTNEFCKIVPKKIA